MSTDPEPTHDELEARVQGFAERVAVGIPSMRTVERGIRRRRTQRRRRFGATVAAFVGVIGFGAVSIIGDRDNSTDHASMSELAERLQRTTSYDFDPLVAQGKTLQDVSAESAIVGRGRIVDARSGYTIQHEEFADGTQDLERSLLLVIEPSVVVKGQDQLGPSGLVFVSQVWSDAYDLESFRSTAISSSDEVAFFLSPVVFESWQNVVDEFAGREESDPVFWPTHASALLGIEKSAGAAMPLLTDEQIEPTPANREALSAVGAEVDRFTVVKLHVHGVPNEELPAEGDVPTGSD